MRHVTFLLMVSTAPTFACGARSSLDGPGLGISAIGGTSANGGTSAAGGAVSTGGTSATSCTIGSKVYLSGAVDPNESCKSCQPLLSTASWSTHCVTAIAAGSGYTCAVVSGAAYCWGFNYYGQLGNNSTIDSHVPVQVQGLTSGVTAIATGMGHTCALVNGSAYSWGYNDSGQLGTNTTTDSLVPVQVQGFTSGVQAIAAGDFHTCALVNGSAYCWGQNYYGQLGNNTTVSSSVPVQVQGLTTGVQAIAAGEAHTCSLVNGSAYCWGANDYGQLGDNSTVSSTVPVQVQGLGAHVQAIAAGDYHTCALIDGVVYCWGSNAAGELGIDTTIVSRPLDSYLPIRVQGLAAGVATIAAGGAYTCALVNGTAYCWGGEAVFAEGGLAAANGARNFVPTQVPGLTGVTTITTGVIHSCALVGGAAYCWGSNYNGGLGNNSTTDSSVPVPVQFP